MENESFKLILRKLENIENTVSMIPVQSEKIERLEEQLSTMWKKYDKVFGIDGVVPKLLAFQSSCPRDSLELRVNTAINRQWTVIGLLASIVCGCLLKAFGIL